MSIPQFTASKSGKSATFRVQNIDHRVDGDEDRLVFYPELQMSDPFGDADGWVKDQSAWPPKVRQHVKDLTYDAAQQAQAVTDLGATLNGKTEMERAVMVAVKCFDNANGATSTIDWGV